MVGYAYPDPHPNPYLHPVLPQIPSSIPKNLYFVCAGAKIIHGSSSETYLPTENSGILSGITSFLFSSNLRRVVIQVRRSLTFHHLQLEPKVLNMVAVHFSQEQTPLHPGNCWCFSGGEGHLVISLAQPAAVSHVTLGHISKSQSPTGNTSSAPRKFSVYVRKTHSKLLRWEDLWTQNHASLFHPVLQGLWNTKDPGIYLGTVTYNIDGPSFQTSRLGVSRQSQTLHSILFLLDDQSTCPSPTSVFWTFSDRH